MSCEVNQLPSFGRPHQQLQGIPQAARLFYFRPRLNVKQKLDLALLAEVLETLLRGLAEGRFGAQLPGLAESRLGLLFPFLGDEDQPAGVIGGLHARVEANGEPERRLVLAVALEVIERS